LEGKPLRRWIPKVVFVALLVFSVKEGNAQCTCAEAYRDITPHAEFKLADLVVIGEVLEIKKTDVDQKSGNYTETVKVKVRTVWKRDIGSIITIRNRVAGCLNGFDEKEEWLLYVYKNHEGWLGTYCCCSRTRPLSRADQDLEEFAKEGEMPARVLHPSVH